MFLYDNYNDLAAYNPNCIEFADSSGFDQSKKKFGQAQKNREQHSSKCY